jgi:polyhydroxyalkanoate synthase
MDRLDIKKYNQYKSEYARFTRSKNELKYLTIPNKEYYKSKITSLLKYNTCNNNKDVFLVVPSIFNSPEILFLSGNAALVPNLLKYGEVYLVNWLENDNQLLMQDLAIELEHIITMIHKHNNVNIHLIGHCIGGNICIAAANICHSALKSLTLLTTPWDFSHLSGFAAMRPVLGLEHVIGNINQIPKIYIQIMFFLMFPKHFQTKIEKYFSRPEHSKRLFLQVEKWLQSGISIPKSLYLQIINEFCLQNNALYNNWKVKDIVIQLKNINLPTCIICASDDEIIPYNSTLPLYKEIKNSKMIRVEGGHINYLINPDHDFQKNYGKWLRSTISEYK